MSAKTRLFCPGTEWLRALQSKSWMNGFWATFRIFFLRPLFLGEDGLRKAGVAGKGEGKGKIGRRRTGILGRHVSATCCGTRKVHGPRLMRLGDVGAYLNAKR